MIVGLNSVSHNCLAGFLPLEPFPQPGYIFWEKVIAIGVKPIVSLKLEFGHHIDALCSHVSE
jgi:hypothetical protein